MARRFEIPDFYRSSISSTIRQRRRDHDQRKKDLAPSVLDLGTVRFKIARHFGFCFGVENAIEIGFRAIAENPDKRIFLLSEMIHNPSVNKDLLARGVRFILKTDGTQLVPFEELKPDDIVIVPAFGTTIELFEKLRSIGINPEIYNTTCPFVEKVWNRSKQLGEQGYTIIIHGKHYHEETRATFSHARLSAPSIVIRDIAEAERLRPYILGEKSDEEFRGEFTGRFSSGFSASRDFARIGVVNQTTMLAGETQAIGEYLKSIIKIRYREADLAHHFADTRDTLCYATAENQNAIQHLVNNGGDFAVVIGGYNSSNTNHLAKICKKKLPTYYIQDAEEIIDRDTIRHLDLATMKAVTTSGWIPKVDRPIEILLSAGASSPDALVDEVVFRIASLLGADTEIEPALSVFQSEYSNFQ